MLVKDLTETFDLVLYVAADRGSPFELSFCSVLSAFTGIFWASNYNAGFPSPKTLLANISTLEQCTSDLSTLQHTLETGVEHNKNRW